MKKNMGLIDRVVRVFIAALIGAGLYTGFITGTAAIVLAILGGVFLITSTLSFCPLYLPFKISTIKK